MTFLKTLSAQIAMPLTERKAARDRRYTASSGSIAIVFLFFVIVTSIISAFQMFDVIFLMIGPEGYALEGTQTLIFLFYEQGFIQGNKGYAAAIVLVLFVIIALVTALQFQMQKRWVHYQ